MVTPKGVANKGCPSRESGMFSGSAKAVGGPRPPPSDEITGAGPVALGEAADADAFVSAPGLESEDMSRASSRTVRARTFFRARAADSMHVYGILALGELAAFLRRASRVTSQVSTL